VTLALLDANVLYPPALRDLFLWLAAGGVYSPRWTETIHDEWMRNVLQNRPDLTPTTATCSPRPSRRRRR
jgi:hypothetical protein